MEKMINKRRCGDENIGKLIAFASIIVIAIGVVGLAGYFYAQSRQVTVNTTILSDVNSSTGDIAKVIPTCNDGSINYNLIDNSYSLSGTTCNISGVKGIKGNNSSYQISK